MYTNLVKFLPIESRGYPGVMSGHYALWKPD